MVLFSCSPAYNCLLTATSLLHSLVVLLLLLRPRPALQGSIQCPPAKAFCANEAITGVRHPEITRWLEWTVFCVATGVPFLTILICICLPPLRRRTVWRCKKCSGALHFALLRPDALKQRLLLLYIALHGKVFATAYRRPCCFGRCSVQATPPNGYEKKIIRLASYVAGVPHVTATISSHLIKKIDEAMRTVGSRESFANQIHSRSWYGGGGGGPKVAPKPMLLPRSWAWNTLPSPEAIDGSDYSEVEVIALDNAPDADVAVQMEAFDVGGSGTERQQPQRVPLGKDLLRSSVQLSAGAGKEAGRGKDRQDFIGKSKNLNWSRSGAVNDIWNCPSSTDAEGVASRAGPAATEDPPVSQLRIAIPPRPETPPEVAIAAAAAMLDDDDDDHDDAAAPAPSEGPPAAATALSKNILQRLQSRNMLLTLYKAFRPNTYPCVAYGLLALNFLGMVLSCAFAALCFLHYDNHRLPLSGAIILVLFLLVVSGVGLSSSRKRATIVSCHTITYHFLLLLFATAVVYFTLRCLSYPASMPSSLVYQLLLPLFTGWSDTTVDRSVSEFSPFHVFLLAVLGAAGVAAILGMVLSAVIMSRPILVSTYATGKALGLSALCRFL